MEGRGASPTSIMQYVSPPSTKATQDTRSIRVIFMGRKRTCFGSLNNNRNTQYTELIRAKM